MIYSLSVHSRVRIQIIEALTWYIENTTGHEKKLLKAFERAIKTIKNNPLKFQIRYDDVRIIHLEKYKYGIHFTVTENKITVLGFYHHHQSSENWTND